MLVFDHPVNFDGRDPLLVGNRPRDLHNFSVVRVWRRARRAIGRTDLRCHDLRHTGLTWAAAPGASVAELMRRGGHANPTAALRYQHATEERDRAIADALGGLAAAV